MGACVDYKMLLGNTSLGVINMTRVNSNILIARPQNYRNHSLREVGPLVARFVRRDLATQRKLFGAIHARWFRWRM